MSTKDTLRSPLSSTKVIENSVGPSSSVSVLVSVLVLVSVATSELVSVFVFVVVSVSVSPQETRKIATRVRSTHIKMLRDFFIIVS